MDEGISSLVQSVGWRRKTPSSNTDWLFYRGISRDPSLQRRQRPALPHPNDASAIACRVDTARWASDCCKKLSFIRVTAIRDTADFPQKYIEDPLQEPRLLFPAYKFLIGE